MSEGCTKCQGKGFIKKPRSFGELTIVEWMATAVAILGVIAAIEYFGESHGEWVFLLILALIIGIPAMQFIFLVGGSLGIIQKKVSCPNCSNDKAEEGSV